MGRYIGAVCRVCRREGEKMFLKGNRCFSPKCAIERRAYPPGEQGQRRRKVSDYGIQLREKQKIRKFYGLLEKQFRIFFKRASQKRGVTAEELLRMLELRLDNLVYRFGFAASRAQARQMVKHGHFRVNGKKVDIPSYLGRPEDVIEVKQSDRIKDRVKEHLESTKGRELPEWLSVDQEAFKGTILKVPSREEISMPYNEQLVVELYSK